MGTGSRRELDATNPGTLTCLKRSRLDMSKQRKQEGRGEIQTARVGESVQMTAFDGQVS